MALAYLKAVGIAALAAAPLNASDSPPDYLGLQEKAEMFAVAANSVISCRHFDYKTDDVGLKLYGQRLIDDAELSGIRGGAADTIVVGALRAETARQSERSKFAEENNDRAGFMEYWRKRCAQLADDEVYSSYFKR